jgi:hypothetical protein
VYTTIVMLLYNVQQDIEHPFDMSGVDDVFFEVRGGHPDCMGALMAETGCSCCLAAQALNCGRRSACRHQPGMQRLPARALSAPGASGRWQHLFIA